jgi:hypothetical protein
MTFRPRAFVLLLHLSVVLTAARADAGISVLSGLTHEQTAQLGESYEGEVVVANNSDQPAQVKVYQTDYSFDATGTAAYDAIGSVARSSGHWVALRSPEILTLTPHQTAAIPFTVVVPAAGDLIGTYWSVLMVEEVPSIVLEAEPATEPSLGVRNVLRYAIQLVTHVGDAGAEDFRVVAMKLEARDAEHLGLLHVDLENSGETLLRADLRFELFDGEGRAIGVFLSGKKRLYPTTSARFTADLSEVPVGSYKLLMMVRMASGSIYASEYKLEPST